MPQYDSSQVLHITHHHQKEHPTVTLAAREEEAVEQPKEAKEGQGITVISFEIWKKGSWDKANGIESGVVLSPEMSN